jgi:CheY-like chemotaxis protein
MRILVAEDETIIRLDLCSALQAAGFETIEARDGAEAVSLAREHEPDLAVLDVKMPNLDGIEAARRITTAQQIPIVLVTAYSDSALVERAIGAGIYAYLVKPFRESEIVPAVETAFARHRDWLETRRELGRRILPDSHSVDVVVQGTNRYPLRITKRSDGSVDVTLSDDS